MSGQPAAYKSAVPATATWTANETRDGTSASDAAFATEGNGWGIVNTTGNKYITIDAGAEITVDALCVLGEQLGSIVYDLSGSTDNFAASDVLLLGNGTFTDPINAGLSQFNSSKTFRYWRFELTSYPSDVFIAHIALSEEFIFPFFETDPDEDGISPTAKHLISKGGLYLGSTQDKAETQMVLNWGEVTTAELPTLAAWADSVIREVNPFFLAVERQTPPISGETRVHFGRLKGGGNWGAPFEIGVNVVKVNTFETRAA